MRVFVYVVAASGNPDALECVVPYKVDDDLIFFGPCKKHLRENFYESYLKNPPATERDVSSRNLHVVGVNGSNPQKKRKIVWAGKVLKVLTFERAHNLFSLDGRFEEMMQREDSPLHIEPIYDGNGTFLGYKLRSSMHEKNDDWTLDIIRAKSGPDVEVRNKSLLLTDLARRKEVFVRDCCFLCGNIFFAQGKGIEIKTHVLGILKKAQPNKSGINEYAVFGLRKDGSADGLTGRYLEVNDESLGKELMDTIAQGPVVRNSSGKEMQSGGSKCQ